VETSAGALLVIHAVPSWVDFAWALMLFERQVDEYFNATNRGATS